MKDGRGTVVELWPIFPYDASSPPKSHRLPTADWLRDVYAVDQPQRFNEYCQGPTSQPREKRKAAQISYIRRELN